MKMKLFAFDVDGTLLDRKNNVVPESALNTIRYLREQGHIVGVATGRNQTQLAKAIDPNEFDFCIICNGGYLEINGKKIYDIQFTLEQKTKVCDVLDQLEYEYGITTEHHLYALNPDSFGVKKIISDYDVITPEKHHNLRELPVYQFTVYEANLTMEKIRHLEDEFVMHAFGDYGYDILIPTIDKSVMLKEVAKMFKINMEDTIAFGDADNDQLFIKEAGIGVAMGNATEGTKENADYITTESYNNGIYNGVKKLGFIK